jgi:hypothetical protein
MSISEYFKIEDLFKIKYLDNDQITKDKLNDILLHPIIKNNENFHSFYTLIPFINDGNFYIALYKKYLNLDNKKINSVFLRGIGLFLLTDDNNNNIYNWNNHDSIDLESDEYKNSYFNLFSAKTYVDYLKENTLFNIDYDNTFSNYKLSCNIKKEDILKINYYLKLSIHDITFTLELLRLMNDTYNFNHTNLNEYHSSKFILQKYKSNVFFNNNQKLYQYDKITYEFYKANFKGFYCRSCNRNFTNNFTFYINLFYGHICVNCYLNKKGKEQKKYYAIKNKMLIESKKMINNKILKDIKFNSNMISKNFYKNISKNLINELNSITTNKCPICFDNLNYNSNIFVTGCGHCLHKNCLEEYKNHLLTPRLSSLLGNIISCPLCKQNTTYTKLHLFNKN